MCLDVQNTSSSCGRPSLTQEETNQHHCMLAGPCKCFWVHSPQSNHPCPVALPPTSPLHTDHPVLIHKPDSCNLYKAMGDTASSPGKGSFPSDPLSAAIFDVVINLYVDTIMAKCSHTGHHFSSSPHQMPILQYADDTCLTASRKANCQAMLNTTQKWLDWSLLKAKVPKCAAISIHGHTGKCTNPHLSISNERIPFLESKSTSLLELPVIATLSTDSIKKQLQQKLEQYLNLTDQSPLSCQQKLRIYKEAICPCLSWLLSLIDLPLTWIERTLEPLATTRLKKWCGLSRPTDPSCIFLNKANGGLGIPSLTTCYKKAQISRYSQLMTSKDSTCRFLAERQHMRDTGMQKKLKLTEEVIATMLEHPDVTGSKLAVEARKRIVSRDEADLTTHASSLMKEHDLFAIKEKDDELWSSTVTKLPENLFVFAMAASVDSLPHNSNLCRWRKLSSALCTICCKIGSHCKQTLAHVLSHCQATLQCGRYNARHDCVLEILFKHLQ